MTEIQITRMLCTLEQREADRAELEMTERKSERVPLAVRMAAHKAAEAAALRRQMIERARARYAA